MPMQSRLICAFMVYNSNPPPPTYILRMKKKMKLIAR